VGETAGASSSPFDVELALSTAPESPPPKNENLPENIAVFWVQGVWFFACESDSDEGKSNEVFPRRRTRIERVNWGCEREFRGMRKKEITGDDQSSVVRFSHGSDLSHREIHSTIS